MKKVLLLAALCVLAPCIFAQEKTERLDSVVVSSSRADKNTPIAFSTVGKDQLRASNPIHSLPMSLDLLPSVVTYNEGGTGLGNSAMTIRGSRGSQINVTLNGITLNDAESQEVFWVNIPALTGLISDVQVQRGLGTSANGAGAFGASINMNTALVQPDPSARLEFSAGSFGTFVTTAAVSTGRLPGGLYFDLAMNLAGTEGYIRNAEVGSSSLFAVIGWLSGPRSLRLTYLMGQQISGITWDGIDLEQYAKDRRYNGAGEYIDDNGNVRYYDNQTDNYAQHHLQLNYSRRFGERFSWVNTVNYTRGDGFDEYYKMNRKFANYGFPSVYSGKSDMIYRKLMDNDLWVLNSGLRYRSDRLTANAGVNLSHYRGGHWGEVLWAKKVAPGFDYSSLDWYGNTGLKNEMSAFVRAEYQPLEWLTAFADLQFRTIGYRLTGADDDWLEYGAAPEDRLDYTRRWNFFNPRAGLTATRGAHKWYASAALGHREPGRGDIKENVKGEGVAIEPERMLDIEVGYAFRARRFSASLNLYAMEYWDMLLETGRLSSSGYAIKENVPRAWRRGVELSAGWEPLDWLRLDGNATFSVNRIADFTSYVPYEDYSATHPVAYGQTTMLMSPSLVGMLRLSLRPWKGGTIAVNGKYVGRQYIDNSMREEMAIPAWWLANLSLGHVFSLGGKSLSLTAYVNNFLNRLYYAAGWRWESYDPESGHIYTGIGVYPQPPCNFMIKVALSL